MMGTQIVDIGLPPGTLIIIEKEKNRFVPCGCRVLENGDQLPIPTNQPQSNYYDNA
jgi:hypothetical protein